MIRNVSEYFVPCHEQSKNYPSSSIKTIIHSSLYRLSVSQIPFKTPFVISLTSGKGRKEINEAKPQVYKHGYFLADGIGIKLNLLKKIKYQNTLINEPSYVNFSYHTIVLFICFTLFHNAKLKL